MKQKINEIKNFVYSLDCVNIPINEVVDSILEFLYKNYHNDDYHDQKFDPIIKGVNFDYDFDGKSLFLRYRLTRRKWLHVTIDGWEFC